MTQFLRVIDPQARAGENGVSDWLQNIEGIEFLPAESGWISVVSAIDRSSADPLVDALCNALSSGDDPSSVAVIQLLHLAAKKRWGLEMWCGNDADDLPSFFELTDAMQALIRQASTQPPEVYLRLEPRPVMKNEQ